MTVEQMKELIRRATEMRNDSYEVFTPEMRRLEPGMATYGHYKIDNDEVVLAVCREMGLDEGFMLPISILVGTGFCELDAWLNNEDDSSVIDIDPKIFDKMIILTHGEPLTPVDVDDRRGFY